MFLQSDTRNNYLLAPKPSERNVFAESFKNKLYSVSGGYSLCLYNHIPHELLKGQSYFEVECQKTRSFENSTLAFRSLGLFVDIASNKVVSTAEGSLVNPSWWTLTQEGLTMAANHLPQVFSPWPTDSEPDRIISSVHGEWDFKRLVFEGDVNFTTWDKVWNEFG